MNKPDIIASPDSGKHVFRSAEVVKCLDTGECVCCGLCCVTFDVIVPVEIPNGVNAAVKTALKPGMEPCRHLRETPEGRFVCEAQDAKSHPALKPCREWRGNRSRAYDFMTALYGFQLISEGDADDILVAEKFSKRGVILNIDLNKFGRAQVRDFIFRCIKLLPELPHNLFEKMRLKEWIKKVGYENFVLLFCDEWEPNSLDLNDDLHLKFAHEYLPWPLSYWRLTV